MDKSPEEVVKEHFDNLIDKHNSEEKKRLASSIKKLKDQLSLVTPELFAEFLDERGASKKCLSCGSKKLSVPESGTIDSQSLPEDFGKLSIDEQTKIVANATKRYVTYSFIEEKSRATLGNAQYRVNCLNCGYMSFYRAGPVLHWVQNLKEDASE
ncbi:Uncharacterised protein [Yersinia intermedia]|uniref:hypothetical protein n=1 Tax=Yersinia intermedia TaxID=631 RepID=UPI0005DDD824|nr:hypothetical protein [Yersinia intermedia]CQD76519.1 Uncharacterised protein [Yersinia intermedia]